MIHFSTFPETAEISSFNFIVKINAPNKIFFMSYVSDIVWISKIVAKNENETFNESVKGHLYECRPATYYLWTFVIQRQFPRTRRLLFPDKRRRDDNSEIKKICCSVRVNIARTCVIKRGRKFLLVKYSCKIWILLIFALTDTEMFKILEVT